MNAFISVMVTIDDITICMPLNLSMFLIISSVSCWQCSQSGLKTIIIAGLFFFRSAFVKKVTLSGNRNFACGNNPNLAEGERVESQNGFFHNIKESIIN